MSFQPYTRQDEVDCYYVGVANHIASLLQDLAGKNGIRNIQFAV